MKKVFPLREPGRVDARVVESVKNDVRKYVKRERRKELPEGFTAWAFSCRVGPDQETAIDCTLPEVTAQIDNVVREGAPAVYVEVLAKPSHRPGQDAGSSGDENDAASP